MQRQDLNAVRTAQDLERKYNFSSMKKNIELNENQIIKTNTTLDQFVVATVEEFENLQNQIDGNITTYYYSGVPTLSNLPASEWTTIEEKNRHLGDLYYDKDTGYAYRFYLDSDTEVYGWVKITDSDVTEALARANAAQDTADSKRRVFVVQPIPPYDVGDIWIKDNQDLYRCQTSRQTGSYTSTDWIIATKYTDDTAANNAQAAVDALELELHTDYVTQTTFETRATGIEANVTQLGVKIGNKNKIFTSQPVPPYAVGDAYIINDVIYTCITARETGNYETEDWEMCLDTSQYVTGSNFEVRVGAIESNVSSSIGNIESEIDSLERSVNTLQTDTYTKTEINTKLTDGSVTKVMTTSGTFDENGMTYAKTNAKTKTTINEVGINVKDTSDSSLLFAGYVDSGNTDYADYVNQTIVGTENIIVKNYLNVGDHLRIQNYTDENSNEGTGFFFM